MRIVDQPVQVKVQDGRPAAFRWRGETNHIICIIDRWSYMGRWWAGEGEWRFWRVETADGGEFELLYDVQRREWRMYRVYD